MATLDSASGIDGTWKNTVKSQVLKNGDLFQEKEGGRCPELSHQFGHIKSL